MSGKTRPVRNRSDFAEALTKLHRLHQESGEQQLRPVPFWKYQRWHQSSSSSSSWWQDSHRFLPGITRNGIRRLLHPAHLGGSGTIPGWAHDNNKKLRNWAHVKSSMVERRDPLCRFFTQPQTCRLSIFFGLLQLDRLQLTVVCCNRRWVWTPHLTRHIFSLIYIHMRGSSRVFGVRTSRVMCHPHAIIQQSWSQRVVVTTPRLLHFLLFAVHLLSYHPVFPPALQLHLPRCGGQIPCALQLMRTCLQNYTHKLGCYARKPHRWLLEYRWVRDLSDYWTGFTQFTLLVEKPPDGYMWSGWRLTRRQVTSRPDHFRARALDKNGKKC